MKKLLFLLTIVCTFGLSGLVSSASAADLNSFTITDYDINMQLGRDRDGRSTLQTTEVITADFSQDNVNRGIERAIPTQYNGHPTSLSVDYVRDGQGQNREYSTYSSGDNMVVRIGDPDAYVSGEQTYEIRYTQRDVTRYFDDTDRDEFYWDTNGTEWKVPIMNLNVSLSVDGAISSALTGNTACYQGRKGSTETCQLTKSGNTFTAVATDLSPRENVTVAIGFEPETFAVYEASLMEKLAIIWGVLQFLTFIVAFVVGIWLIVRFMRMINRSSELDPISPEYIPPTDTSVTTSAKLAKHATGSVMTAQLIDLAVRHYIKLYEVKEKTFWRPAEYEIEIIKDLSGLREEEQELLKDMFGSLPNVGKRMNLKELKNNTKYFKRTTDNDKKLIELVRGQYALRAIDKDAKQWYKKAALVLLIAGLVTLSIPLLVVAAIALALASMVYRLTDKGLNLRRYLEGLKMYIGVAEKDRLKMLQSPEGVQKVKKAVGGTDEKSLIKLYERVLPYAILFNQEKEWSKSLGNYYEQTGDQPDWYTGQGAFNTAVFTSAIGNISQASTYASSSSSSSGGSGGGGFSGGGGGGGGGGGW